MLSQIFPKILGVRASPPPYVTQLAQGPQMITIRITFHAKASSMPSQSLAWNLLRVRVRVRVRVNRLLSCAARCAINPTYGYIQLFIVNHPTNDRKGLYLRTMGV